MANKIKNLGKALFLGAAGALYFASPAGATSGEGVGGCDENQDEIGTQQVNCPKEEVQTTTPTIPTHCGSPNSEDFISAIGARELLGYSQDATDYECRSVTEVAEGVYVANGLERAPISDLCQNDSVEVMCVDTSSAPFVVEEQPDALVEIIPEAVEQPDVLEVVPEVVVEQPNLTNGNGSTEEQDTPMVLRTSNVGKVDTSKVRHRLGLSDRLSGSSGYGTTNVLSATYNLRIPLGGGDSGALVPHVSVGWGYNGTGRDSEALPTEGDSNDFRENIDNTTYLVGTESWTRDTLTTYANNRNMFNLEAGLDYQFETDTIVAPFVGARVAGLFSKDANARTDVTESFSAEAYLERNGEHFQDVETTSDVQTSSSDQSIDQRALQVLATGGICLEGARVTPCFSAHAGGQYGTMNGQDDPSSRFVYGGTVDLLIDLGPGEKGDQ